MEKLIKSTINWLLRMESGAADVYAKAADTFSEQRGIADFFLQLSQEERQHESMLADVMSGLEDLNQLSELEYYLDESKCYELEMKLNEMMRLLDQENISCGNLLNKLIDIELSEWNALFVYVISYMSAKERNGQQMAAMIHSHLDRIKAFVKSAPCSSQSNVELPEFPKIWEKKILVVDDEDIILELHKELLDGVAEVVCAHSASEAMAALKEHYFDLIIADYHMPGIDGMMIFDQLLEREEDIQNRFILSSSGAPHSVIKRCKVEGITYLERPVALDRVLQTVKNKL